MQTLRHWLFRRNNGKVRPGRNQFTPKLELLESRQLLATTILVDLNQVADPMGGTLGSRPMNLTPVGAKLFFSADNGVIGRELFVNDGNTYTGFNINPAGSSDPDKLINANGLCYFTADDGSHGREVWVSDGTVQGTKMVKDIAWAPMQPAMTSNPDYLTFRGGLVYFAATTIEKGRELWYTDGSENGTQCIDMLPGGDGIDPKYIVNLNNTLYFNADGPDAGGNKAYGRELWKATGTATTDLQLVEDIFPGGSSDPALLTAGDGANGRLFFSANDGQHEREPWSSDGTANGTDLLWDVWQNNGMGGNPSSTPHQFAVVNNGLFFGATRNDPTFPNMAWMNGIELFWATPQGNNSMWDIDPGQGSSSPSYMTAVGGKVFFVARKPNLGEELWVATPQNNDYQVSPTKDIAVGNFGSGPSYLRNIAGELYFSATDRDAMGMSHGAEPWKSDGTANGTVRVKDINEHNMGQDSSFPKEYVLVGNSLIFAADDGDHGHELWDPKIRKRPGGMSSLAMFKKKWLQADVLFALDSNLWRRRRGGP